jgi:hypothetical protein
MKQKQLYTVAALLFFVAGAISFPAHMPALGAMWLCIGVLFFAVGQRKT